MRLADLVCAIAGAALAIAYFLLAAALPTSLLSDAVGADAVPKLLAVALGLLSILLGVRAAMSSGAAWPVRLADHVRPIGIAMLGCAYALAAPLLGYPVALALLIAATLVYFGARIDRAAIATAIVGAACFWLIFARVLGVSMPKGALLRFLG